MPQRVGLVLAGGRGRRLGRPKGPIELEGRTLAARAAAALWPLCGSVLISVGTSGDDPAPDYPKVVDPPPPGRGPLVGLDAAFEASGDADLLVLACDYPFVTRDLLERLAATPVDAENLIMLTDSAGRDHPLVALWRRDAAAVVRAAVAAERLKVRALLADLEVLRLAPADLPGFDLDRALLNVNEPEQLERLLGDTPGASERWPS
jgi:molybdopterin-guanine dinucleotide biosynthesis protein A